MTELLTVLALIAAVGVVVLMVAKVFVAMIDIALDCWWLR